MFQSKKCFICKKRIKSDAKNIVLVTSVSVISGGSDCFVSQLVLNVLVILLLCIYVSKEVTAGPSTANDLSETHAKSNVYEGMLCCLTMVDIHMI